jgi:hypothetical protein
MEVPGAMCLLLLLHDIPPALAWWRRSNKRWDDASVSPVIRQTLLHW